MKTTFSAIFLALTMSVFAEAPGGFLFATFRDAPGNSGEQVYFALSRDGKTWAARNDGKPCLVSEIGAQGARDPFLLRSHDDKTFYLIATDLSISRLQDWGKAVREGSRNIIVWESKDLVAWSQPRLIAVAPEDAGCTWSPEAIYDPTTDDYLIYWASTTKRDDFAKHRIWAARTKDFRTFGEPFIYTDNPTTTIDTTIVQDGQRYYRFTKNEQFKTITMEQAGKLAGPWTNVAGFNLGKLIGYEGPACFLREPAANGKPATWCLMLDHYAEGRGYEAFLCHDLSSGVFEPATDVSFPFKFRHGSVLSLTEAEYRRIESTPMTVVNSDSSPSTIRPKL